MKTTPSAKAKLTKATNPQQANSKTWALILSLGCVPILTVGMCESAVAFEGHKVVMPDGYLSDAADVREHGGVGNYFFRYLRENENKTAMKDGSQNADELNYSSQASAIRAPASLVQEKFFFENESARLTSRANAKLDSVAQDLKNSPAKELEIKGYADATGTEAYNDDLSKRRAKAVVEALRHRGVPTAQLRWEGKGISDPIGDNASPEGRAQNRRVEILQE